MRSTRYSGEVFNEMFMSLYLIDMNIGSDESFSRFILCDRNMTSLKKELIEIVNMIPKRRVAYYGQISEILRERLEKNISAQLVGWQLSGMQEHERSQLPWWRVVSKEGYISSLKLGEKGIKQIHLLEKEGIPVENTKVDMEIYGVEMTELVV